MLSDAERKSPRVLSKISASSVGVHFSRRGKPTQTGVAADSMYRLRIEDIKGAKVVTSYTRPRPSISY
jgi:hypothetical protein